MSADGSVRKFVNDMFRGKDSFQVAAITTGALFVCGGVAYTARALADGSAQKNFYRFLFSAVKNAPGAVGKEAERQRREALQTISKELLVVDPEGVIACERIPERGIDRNEVLRQMQVLCDRDDAAHNGAVISGCIYWGDKEHTKFLARVQEMFLLTNPLHPDIFPAIGKFEREIITMTKCMLGAKPNDSVCGIVTSGGEP